MELVSVVIPTYQRANKKSEELLERALKSVLNQTYQNIEIIIVIDGVSQEIKEKFSGRFENVTIIETEDKVGGSKTRNIGIDRANGQWIALLDDDDEWKEEKISEQMKVISNIDDNEKEKIVCFTSLIEDGKTSKVLPNFSWQSQLSISEYLFGRIGFKRIGFIQTSTILASKILFLNCPFTNGLIKHQDWDWLLRVKNISGVKIAQIEKPLAYYHTDVPMNQRVGYVNRWRFTEQWGKENRDLMTKRGYTFFIINIVFIDLVRDKEINKMKKLALILKKFKQIPYQDKWSKDCLQNMGIVFATLIKD